MELLKQIEELVVRGHIDADSRYPKDLSGQPGVREKVADALEKGISPQDILTNGLISGMKIVGEKYEKNEIFVPEMLFSAKAMKSGLNQIRPMLVGDVSVRVGTVILGTVQGDMHDIGKNLVGMMLEGAGFEVIDLGINTPVSKFVESARQHPEAVIGMSALLTVTMKNMKTVIESLRSNGLENKVMIGGAPVTQSFADEIGAEGYSLNANQAVSLAKNLMSA
ncbi:TPA: cobalamin-binding protein [Candidatus Marinimicrobia bacterium]|nr:MAG: Methyltransferase cognate corrinoid protein [Marinimicrobia bacterium 46_47]KUK92987.1 MAG: Methyltransferase cognate corrinoid protein [Marinimicrobia bacterium 46_43]HAE87239.1 cobalamin-binding protein [Candidatus Neomarinimicrobiota bacterium]HBY18958.1 cobalamin-binding protein [Candidatus Neomarinimicrobiota bacterium]